MGREEVGAGRVPLRLAAVAVATHFDMPEAARMRRRAPLWSAFLAASALVACCVVFDWPCRAWYWGARLSYCDFKRVEIGMTLQEVEAILGPGREISAKELPGEPDFDEPDLDKRVKPVVQGDRFFEWLGGGAEVFVAFRDGRVCDKWYWEASL